MLSARDPLNLIVCGVGGQGNVLTAQIMGRYFVKDYFVTVADRFGMAQRGGAVTSFIRASRKNFWAPVIPCGKAHLILSFEPLEALRNLLLYGNRETIVITNSYPFLPLKVRTREADYPSIDRIKELLSEFSKKSFIINATDIISELGTRYLNTFMVGVLMGTNTLSLNQEKVEDVIKEGFRKEIAEINLKAFRLGLESITLAAPSCSSNKPERHGSTGFARE